MQLGAGTLLCAWLSALAYAQAPATPPASGGQRPGAPGPVTAGGAQPPGGAASGSAPASGGQGSAPAGAGQRRAPADSPASQRPPTSAARQTYPPAQIEAGQTRFAAQCGFCHGRDAAGGETGPDLTRSALVAGDVRGDKLKPVIRTGRPEKGMPAFTLSDTDLTAIVAFIHDAKAKAESESGGRRSVDVTDLQTGNADAGKQYFYGPGRCASCHALTSDFATVGARYQGLALLQRLLYPGSGARTGNPPPAPPTMTVTTAKGESVTGKLVYRDEFTISVINADGWTRSFHIANVTIRGDEPLKAHVDQLGKYTDEDMHNVFAYLETLR